MNSSFNVVSDNLYDRNFGGTSKGTADPYISGTHFIKFLALPKNLITSVQRLQGAANFSSNEDIGKYLRATCLSVTVPGGTVNRAQFVGLGNTKWNVATTVDYGDSLTLKFVEMSAAPVLAISSGWVRMIRDIKNGISSITAKGANDYNTKDLYSATLLYWTTKPDGLTVETATMFPGVFPLKDPADLYGSDVTSVDKLEVDIEFSCDRPIREQFVFQRAIEEAKAVRDGIIAYRGAMDTALSAAPSGIDTP